MYCNTELKQYQRDKIHYWEAHAEDRFYYAYRGKWKPYFRTQMDAVISISMSFASGHEFSPGSLTAFLLQAPITRGWDRVIIDDVVDIVCFRFSKFHETTSTILAYVFQAGKQVMRKDIASALSLTAKQVRDALKTLVSRGVVTDVGKMVCFVNTFRNWLWCRVHVGKLPKKHAYSQFTEDTPAKRRTKVKYDVPRVCVDLFGANEDCLESEKPITIRCPLGTHRDTNPSCVVFLEGNYYCHGCPENCKNGKLLDLVAGALFPDDKMGTIQASSYLRRYEIDPGEVDDSAYCYDAVKRRQREKSQRYARERDLAERFYHAQFFREEYYRWKWVGVSSYTRAQQELLSVTKKRPVAFDPAILERHHVYTFELDHQHPIVFPLVCDGVVVGEQSMAPEWIRKLHPEMPKYLTTKGLQKKLYVYGHLNDSPVLMVTEGYKNAMMSDQRGHHNTGATLGAMMSDEQADYVAANYEAVIVAYEYDRAGDSGYVEAERKLIARGMRKVTRLPLTECDIEESTIEEYRYAVVQAYQELGYPVPMDVLSYGLENASV